MESPWGEIEVWDAHVHFFSHRFFGLLGEQMAERTGTEAVCAKAGVAVPPEDPAELARLWAAELDRHAVAGAALLASLPDDEGSVAAALRAVPGRFCGHFFVNPLAGGALEKAESAFNDGLRTLCLLPAMHGFSLGDRRVEPFLSLAAERGANVFVHCGVLSVGIRKKLGLESRFDLRYSNPVDLHPIALRLESVNFIVPHFGAGYFREALMVASLCPNVYLDTSSSNSWRKYMAPQPSLEEVFERALDVAGDGRLLFGTDSSFFPRGWNRAVYEEQAACLAKLGASPETVKRVFGGNLRRLMDGRRGSPGNRSADC
jgi:hypothetical protein